MQDFDATSAKGAIYLALDRHVMKGKGYVIMEEISILMATRGDVEKNQLALASSG